MFQLMGQGIPGVIRLEGEGEDCDLVWETSEMGALSKAKKVLGPFCKLAGAEPKRFLLFAEKYGILGLCPHGLPAAECEECPVVRMPEQYARREPIRVWRWYAQHVKAIRDLGVELRYTGDARTISADWALALGASEKTVAAIWQDRDPTSVLSPSNKMGLVGIWGEPFHVRDQQVVAISMVLNHLLAITRPTIAFVWSPRHDPVLSLGTPMMFNVLHPITLELAYELISPSESPRPEPVTCANCGDVYSPEYRTPASRKTWCSNDDCRKASSANSSKCWRARQSNAARR